MTTTSTFSTTGISFYFQSKRANVDGRATDHLVQFIQGAKHSLDVAIYDMKNPDVLKALKKMSSKVRLHIAYDGGTGSMVGGGSTTVDPKVGTGKAIIDAGLKAFAHPVMEKRRHLM